MPFQPASLLGLLLLNALAPGAAPKPTTPPRIAVRAEAARFDLDRAAAMRRRLHPRPAAKLVRDLAQAREGGGPREIAETAAELCGLGNDESRHACRVAESHAGNLGPTRRAVFVQGS